MDDIPVEVQVKLLRVLQERAFERVGGESLIRVNVRVIAASKKSLSSLVEAGRFREDLYYRLNVVPLKMPLLREHLADIPLLVEYFLQRLAVKLNRGTLKITPKAMIKLQRYSWPGNVRELEHFIERIVVISGKNELNVQDITDLASFPEAANPVSVSLKGVETINLDTVLSETEERLIRWAMERSQNNLTYAAEMLGIPRSTLQYKLTKL